MRFIPLRDNKPDDEWCRKADEITQKLLEESDIEERKKIIDKHDSLWGKIKEHLLKISHQKCWYSEAKESFSHYHVDHFRPKKKAIDLEGNDKGGYWWLAFEWTNYRISGSVGNVKKGDRFSVLRHKAALPSDPLDDEIVYFLDPTDENDPPLLTFDGRGTAKPINPNEDEWEHKRAKYTIENLDLNYEPLQEARKAIWNKCIALIDEIETIRKDYNTEPSISKKEKLKEKQQQLLEYIKSCSEFSATAISCLIGSGITWAQSMAHRSDQMAKIA